MRILKIKIVEHFSAEPNAHFVNDHKGRINDGN
jgi:hypothetical protein